MDSIEKVSLEFDNDSKNVQTISDCENLRIKYLGKKGLVTNLMPMIKEIPNEQKREFGQSLNALKNKIEQFINDKKAILEKENVYKKLKEEKVIDITLPVEHSTGSLHPRTTLQKEIEQIFISMGFVVEDGFEIETEFNNFDALNVSKNHPARDAQDTFWLTNGQLLKTHTSASQNRILRKYNGPLKAIYPGRCFRNEAVDQTHENTFFQIEGMLVDTNVSIANLIFFMKKMLSELFKKEINVRLRPGFFPFVEPGFELDAQCTFCDGKGCKVCKNSGWLELCPCGMIHPKVLQHAGLDSEKYCGFAFGLGFDRLVMLETGINDIRHLNSGNLKILKQFKVKA